MIFTPWGGNSATSGYTTTYNDGGAYVPGDAIYADRMNAALRMSSLIAAAIGNAVPEFANKTIDSGSIDLTGTMFAVPTTYAPTVEGSTAKNLTFFAGTSAAVTFGPDAAPTKNDSGDEVNRPGLLLIHQTAGNPGVAISGGGANTYPQIRIFNNSGVEKIYLNGYEGDITAAGNIEANNVLINDKVVSPNYDIPENNIIFKAASNVSSVASISGYDAQANITPGLYLVQLYQAATQRNFIKTVVVPTNGNFTDILNYYYNAQTGIHPGSTIVGKFTNAGYVIETTALNGTFYIRQIIRLSKMLIPVLTAV